MSAKRRREATTKFSRIRGRGRRAFTFPLSRLRASEVKRYHGRVLVTPFLLLSIVPPPPSPVVVTPTPAPFDPAAHRVEIEAWQKARNARLAAPDGWLTLVGLFWLKPGVSRFGTAADNDIVLPPHTAAPHAGTLAVEKSGDVTLQLASDQPAKLRDQAVSTAILHSDAAGRAPDVVALGTTSLQIIHRNGRLAVRVKDSNSKLRRQWKGLRYYPIDARYRVTARFVANAQPVSIVVPNVLGFADPMPSPGHAEFEWEGRTVRLDAVVDSPGDPQLFFVFRDRTAGKTTYGAGRFLYADPPQGGHVVLDFNKAYTPPCAFTAYATCPLPPETNRLATAIEAGELFDGH